MHPAARDPQRAGQVLGDAPEHLDVTAGRGGGEGPRARGDPVGDDGVLDGREPLDPLDHETRRAGARDPRAHRDEHLGDVDDLGLPGGVLDARRAASQHGGGQDVLGRADAGEVEPDLGAVEPVGRLRDEEAVGHVHGGAERLEPGRVQVETA